MTAAAAASAVALAVITAAADRLRCARLSAAGNKCPVKSDPESSRYDNVAVAVAVIMINIIFFFSMSHLYNTGRLRTILLLFNNVF